MSCCACRSRAIPSPRSACATSCSIPRPGTATTPCRSNPGNRARFAGFTTEGDLAFDAKHVGVLSRFKRGELYDSRKVDDLREAMVATSLFTTVSAEPVATGEMAEDGTEYVNILVRQDAGPARSLAGTAGYSAPARASGPRRPGSIATCSRPKARCWSPPSPAPRSRLLRVRFRRNNWKKRDRSIFVQAEAGRRDLPAFKGYTARLHGLVARESTPIWQKVWTYAYGAELIATNESADRLPAALDQPTPSSSAG